MNQEEKKHLSKVAAIGCVLCHLQGTPGTLAEIHHPRKGTGMAQRASHYDAIPLCPEHHRGKTGVHGLGTKGFPKHWGFAETDLLEDVKVLLKGET